MNESTSAGPAPYLTISPDGSVSPAAAVPIDEKIPAPITAPMESITRSPTPRARFRPPWFSVSAIRSAIGFLANSDMRLALDPGRVRNRRRTLDAHGVERPPDEDERNREERSRQDVAQAGPLLAGQRHRQLDGEQAEQRRELDDRIERHG